MHPLYLVSAVVISVFTVQPSFSALYPIAGDTSAVWTAIDLLPTSNRLDQATIALNDTPASDPTAVVAQSSATPAAPPTRTVTTHSTTVQQQPATQPMVTEDIAPVVETPVIVPGTIIITSIPDNAQISINDVNVGATPYNVSGFYPGVYDIALTVNGYAAFKKSIELKAGATEFITGNMVKESGYLYVVSTPENATVSVNDTIVGMTPYLSKSMQPGIYSLKIDLPGYQSYTEQLGVAASLTDTLQIALLAMEKQGLFNDIRFAETQTVRRIAFGAVGAIATVTGIIFNNMTKNNLDKEYAAWEQYKEARLAESEYTVRYDEYHSRTKTTDQSVLLRNICYGLGIAGGVGFAISIPY